jgi:retinol dehydrogenase-12
MKAEEKIMTQKVVIVTGGNRGLGAATARQLAEQGNHVIITARKKAEGEEAAAAIRQKFPAAQIDVAELDLAALGSVRRFAQEFLARGLPLHVLINNAGYYNMDSARQLTADGFERHFGTNHLGHFLLTLLLLDKLQQSAPARVVVLSSGLHAGGMGTPPAQVRFDDLKWDRDYKARAAYGMSKLCNLLFTYELNRRYASHGVVANATSPMVVPETLAITSKGFERIFMKYIMPFFPISRTAAQAAANTVFAALDPAAEKEGGKYFEDMKPIKSSPASYDEAVAKRLWDLSLQLTGLSADSPKS